MKHKILMGILLIGLTACMKVVKKGDEDKVAPAIIPELQLDVSKTPDRTELTYSYDVDGKANLKKVRFTAATNWPESVVVKKKDGDKFSEFGAEFNANSEWSDLLISENKVNYQFFSKIANQLILLDEVEVVPPLNMDVVEDLNLAQKYALNEKTKLIYFENLRLGLQKRIYLENYSGKIHIQHLESKSGFIQGYSANARAANGFDGKDGGILRIEILNGTGDVTVFMKGENGGHGAPAKEPDAALKGNAGKPGTPAEFKFSAASDGSISYSCSTTAGAGGAGHKGHRGNPGNPGNPGKSGGHSGKAIVMNLSTNLEIFLESQPGAFGVGSPGGSGGEGGEPGLPADGGDEDYQHFLRSKNACIDLGGGRCYTYGVTITDRCGPGAAGRKGDSGESGENAGNGVDGTKQKSCLYQNEQIVKCINE